MLPAIVTEGKTNLFISEPGKLSNSTSPYYRRKVKRFYFDNTKYLEKGEKAFNHPERRNLETTQPRDVILGDFTKRIDLRVAEMKSSLTGMKARVVVQLTT